jgi:phosphoenolpyruvate carboxylase
MRDLKEYNEVVSHPFHVFNGIFLTLPLDGIRQTGLRIPLLQEACESGLDAGKSPTEIMNAFFSSQGLEDAESKKDLLFKIIQYVERQVVLVDALEDARYSQLNDLAGSDSLQSLMQRVRRNGMGGELKEALSDYAVRVVLTAHPTQFYPGHALAIITDLSEAMEKNDLVTVRKLLHQLGLTPFFQSEPPSPYEEAVRQSWYLENVFFHAAPDLFSKVAHLLDDAAVEELNDGLIAIGFWPGGDRDGNPFVTTQTTLDVAARLQVTLLRCYRRELRSLRRRITFKEVSSKLDALQSLVEFSILHGSEPGSEPLTPDALLAPLREISEMVEARYNGLYLEEIQRFIFKIRLFGMHFASIDVRQDSRVIKAAWKAGTAGVGSAIGAANGDEEVGLPGGAPLELEGLLDCSLEGVERTSRAVRAFLEQEGGDEDDRARDVWEVLGAIREIQIANGPRACHRFIISNCRCAEDVATVYQMALSRMGKTEAGQVALDLDVVPLFETIADLSRAEDEMARLYENPTYRRHLAARGDRQTIMLGFSDGTKDGGYLQANWSIYKAKQALTRVSRQAGVRVLFFDGRGGPPARGGGNTHRFYASLGPDIENTEIQTTIQGQTISSNFGIPRSAGFNLELLLTAGLKNRLFDDLGTRLTSAQQGLLDELGAWGLEQYTELKHRPAFLDYLATWGTLKYYGETNVGSRPTTRMTKGPLTLDDLRAIPFVGSWSQLKQNVPGFYGLGTALAKLDSQGRLDEARALFAESGFFRALIENSMQSMKKSDFRFTEHLANDPRFGAMWSEIKAEFDRTKRYVLAISGQSMLMENSPSIRASIELRGGIISPLLVIQHYALAELQRAELQSKTGRGKSPAGWHIESLERLVIRSMYGIINASRNAV